MYRSCTVYVANARHLPPSLRAEEGVFNHQIIISRTNCSIVKGKKRKKNLSFLLFAELGVGGKTTDV